MRYHPSLKESAARDGSIIFFSGADIDKLSMLQLKKKKAPTRVSSHSELSGSHTQKIKVGERLVGTDVFKGRGEGDEKGH